MFGHDLSHAHHAQVAWLRKADEQEWWLGHAARHDLTVEEFRRALGRGSASAASGLSSA
jgi:hypothetical protein